jgi:DNA helicase-2/ATP-dependent DNA helicase PcrA
MQHLEGLNDAQREAVLATEGPVSVLAGAGSGKTRVLTTRIVHLIKEGVPANRILAVTFTNKAAREMRERLAHRLGDSPLPFVATFHGLGRDILQRYGSRIGISRYFTIFDRDDSKSAIKRVLKEMDIDPKEMNPNFVLSRISKEKGEGSTPDAFREKYAQKSFQSRVIAEVWPKYEAILKKEKALDFDDLICLPVRLLREHEDIRREAEQLYSHVHVDEFQDTNELQGKLVDMLTQPQNNVFVVGDIDQCLVAGTEVHMADGSKKSIELIEEGDSVLSNFGSGDLRASIVTKAMEREFSGDLVRITTTSGRSLTSTPEHIHFAGYRLGIVPQKYFTYLMHKKEVGWRLGVSQTYTNGQRLPMLGFKQRANHEHADSVWIVGVFDSTQDARVHEYKLSLTYGIPTLPFVARKGSVGGYVHDQKTLGAIFASFDTDAAARKLLSDRELSLSYPHHRAQATRSNRRNIVMTLCGDHRGSTPVHRISIVGSDGIGKEALVAAGFSVRSAKLGSKSWRFETAHVDYGKAREISDRLLILFPDALVVEAARLGGKKTNSKDANSLPFLPAASVLPGMAMFDEEGGWDIVETVDRIPAKNIPVFDLNIEGTHNFIANGLSTHNCIYTWRGATIENLLKFEEQYENAKTIVLAHNYRSTKTIVAAGNQIIEKNQNRKDKHAVTDNADGEPIRLHIARNAESEARWVAREARKALQQGIPPEEVAVLFRTNFQSRALEEAFLSEGLPYKVLGTRFLDRKEVKDVLAWVRLALDTEREVDRIRAVQAPTRGIGKVTLGKLVDGRRDTLKPAEVKKVAAFEAIVMELNELSKSAVPSEFVKLVIERSGLADALRKGGEEDVERLENAKELATLASRYDGMPGEEGIAAFLAESALAGDQDELDAPGTTGITLMTVHAAKGLEFDTVFVTGMEQGLFPHEAREGEKRDEEEERRLFYVAVTRAKRRLNLTLATVRRIYGTDFASEPSMFIRDIDEGLISFSEGDELYGERTIYI